MTEKPIVHLNQNIATSLCLYGRFLSEKNVLSIKWKCNGDEPNIR
jgi:hypothetical protein